MSTSDDDLNAALAVLLPQEGGYSNDPDDAGGETNWGITAFEARAFGYAGSMKDMTRDQATAIYRAKYWVQPQLDQLDAIDSQLARRLFNLGVNIGSATANAFPQRALNVLNLGGTLWPDIKVDGLFGALSRAAYVEYVKSRGESGRVLMQEMVEALASVHYIEIAETVPVDEKFEYGWQSVRAFGPA